VSPIKNRHETSTRRPGSSEAEFAGTSAGRGGPAGEDGLGDFAADLGHFLGTVQNRAAGWLEQRKKITDQLTQIRDTANDYLRQLGAADLMGGVRRGRRPAAQSSPASRGRRKKRTMSPEARERIAEAQRRRWAKHRKAKAAGNA
jgi:hypothetical protein